MKDHMQSRWTENTNISGCKHGSMWTPCAVLCYIPHPGSFDREKREEELGKLEEKIFKATHAEETSQIQQCVNIKMISSVQEMTSLGLTKIRYLILHILYEH